MPLKAHIQPRQTSNPKRSYSIAFMRHGLDAGKRSLKTKDWKVAQEKLGEIQEKLKHYNDAGDSLEKDDLPDKFFGTNKKVVKLPTCRLDELWSSYIEKPMADTTRKIRRSHYNRFLEFFGAHFNLSKLKHAKIQDYIDQRLKKR